MARTFELTSNNRSEGFVLPINPQSFELAGAALNQKVTLLNMGEVNLLGHRGLITGSLSGFFPSERSPHFKRADRTPIAYIRLLEKWRDSQTPIRLIVSGSEINLAMAIDKVTHSVREGDDDIYYTLELSEYRELNVPTVKVSTKVKSNGLNSRPNTQATAKTYTVKAGDSLWSISEKTGLGGANYPKLYSANRSVIDEKNKGTGNPRYTIYPGQVFTIP